ncbi:hypothetical protein [Ammoniphilus sp. CFH 90114]|uniref:hypothetical protein n=1 Tax=Ammoniphilus sp. CFH 90114 TaxID=2493665 RepID=UPI00100FDFD4|nr:hypothetical protein [Ammoniphilus sp. CFH 90114]RXT03913.1 hypothetical protein EIZ39_22385 [Ammoniphilus sp. CFH 90114]
MKFAFSLLLTSVLLIFLYFKIEGSEVTDSFIVVSNTLTVIALSLFGVFIIFNKRDLRFIFKFVITFIVSYLICSIPTMYHVGRPDWVVGITTFQRFEWFIVDGLSMAFIDSRTTFVFFIKLMISILSGILVSTLMNVKKKKTNQSY